MVERLEGLEGLDMLREAFRQVCLQRAVAAFRYRVGYCEAALVDVDVLSGFGATLEVRTMKIGEVHSFGFGWVFWGGLLKSWEVGGCSCRAPV